MSDTETSGVKRSPPREFGHARRGWAVEFNLDGVCACRTLTMETRKEAMAFKHQLESRDDTSRVEVVCHD